MSGARVFWKSSVLHEAESDAAASAPNKEKKYFLSASNTSNCRSAVIFTPVAISACTTSGRGIDVGVVTTGESVAVMDGSDTITDAAFALGTV